VIRIDNQQYWLYAAVDPKSNELLHVRLFSTTTTALTELFLQELTEKTRRRERRVSCRFSKTS